MFKAPPGPRSLREREAAQQHVQGKGKKAGRLGCWGRNIHESMYALK